MTELAYELVPGRPSFHIREEAACLPVQRMEIDGLKQLLREAESA